jgi:predicted transcriptional regulator of viral defense system
MSSLAQQVSASALRDRVFNERQLSELLGGGDARRYGLVNRALKDGSLIRLKRGVYTLAKAHRSAPMHPFAVAQALLPGSYISFESALAYHGWIPEAVLVTASVTPGRKTLEIPATEFGSFKYHPLAIADYRFLSGVERVTFDKLTAFVAKPLRALMDLVALRKVDRRHSRSVSLAPLHPAASAPPPSAGKVIPQIRATSFCPSPAPPSLPCRVAADCW